MNTRRALTGTLLGGLALTVFCFGQLAAAIGTPPPMAPLSLGEAPLQPEFLQVSGGEDSWHPDNDFRLDWANPASPSPAAIDAVHYRVWSEDKTAVVPDTRIGGPPSTIYPIRVPEIPGVYTAEVWLEDELGRAGTPAIAKLRFDDSRPGSVDPFPAPGWIGRTAFPRLVRLGHPLGPAPVSGLRGYAVSVDPDVGGSPCAARDRCTDLETDLRAGIEGDSVALAGLPEGTSYIHAVAVSNSGMRSATVGTAALHVDTTDPLSALSGAPGGWTNRPVTLTASASDAASGMQAAGSAGPFTAIRIDDGAPVTAAGNSVSVTVIGDGIHPVAYYARDGAGNVNDGAAGKLAVDRPPSTTTVRIDRAPPGAAFASAQRAADPELIEARVSDSLSGPSSSEGAIAIRRRASREQFEPLRTEISGGVLRARWDSDAYPTGAYEFRATAYDAAGNLVTTGRRANGTAMILSNPLKTPTSIESGFGGAVLAWHHCRRDGRRRQCRREVIGGFERRPRQRLVPYGKSMLFSGRLTATTGAALEQAQVQISEDFDPGSAQPDRLTTVRTDADGTFTVRLAPGPSRQIGAAFAGTRTLSRCDDDPVRLGVRAGVRLRASSTVAAIGGRPVVFSGRVGAGAAEIPGEGKAIQLQFRLPGIPWSEFRTIQADASGHFHYAYRFSDDDSRGVRFQFRAFAPAQAGWPFEPAASRPVMVRGR